MSFNSALKGLSSLIAMVCLVWILFIFFKMTSVYVRIDEIKDNKNTQEYGKLYSESIVLLGEFSSNEKPTPFLIVILLKKFISSIAIVLFYNSIGG